MRAVARRDMQPGDWTQAARDSEGPRNLRCPVPAPPLCQPTQQAPGPLQMTWETALKSQEKEREKCNVRVTQSSESSLSHHSQDFNASPRKKAARKEHQASLPARHLPQQCCSSASEYTVSLQNLYPHSNLG